MKPRSGIEVIKLLLILQFSISEIPSLIALSIFSFMNK